MANGHAWATLSAALLAPGGEIHNLAVARHQDWGAVDFDVDVLAALLDDFGLPSLGASAPRSVTVWQRGCFAALEAAIRDAARDAASFPLGFIPHGMLSALRESVMDALLSGLAAMKADESGLPRRTQEGLRIVKAADQMLCDDPARPIYTEALCEALAVSPSKLFKAFMATYGVSPHHFLKCRRLSLVRRALRVAAPGHRSVKRAALSYGFANMGRFADEYRTMFGEMPSQTLAWSLR
jgi:AraC family ethanolamine operon transcriptional activator